MGSQEPLMPADGRTSTSMVEYKGIPYVTASLSNETGSSEAFQLKSSSLKHP
ncbi:MAG: hypothetical protein JRN26_05940 [Nitrososphaerota archaeon]|nr:hypothetical protein [Nitrososphaerota archaeon]MDG6926988.1 hypothetical protein [Nitrososphaerota archaeon]MDG6930451.1 hypothetical protein [Nitrososphaerota archaeon]MDG6931492.1 hypothetical protein [Nitrososphaerota archaeon]MDG6936403.1 hypothetical protein [Nitrososphaerota archaeon]